MGDNVNQQDHHSEMVVALWPPNFFSDFSKSPAESEDSHIIYMEICILKDILKESGNIPNS